MRTEKEMMELILDVAREDERIRTVIMVGSRANPDVVRDKYQDYDITYCVNRVAPFYNNREWIESKFGKPAIMQLPECMTLLPPQGDGHFTYLMIFEEGNRIDLSIEDKPYIHNGEPAVILLDKDGNQPDIPAPSGRHWYIKAPTEKLFTDCCNEFWWCLNNVGKGIARDQLSYVMWMYNVVVRDMLEKMLEWFIGTNTNFSVSTGSHGKYFKKYLSPELYKMFTETYSEGNSSHLWVSISKACDLFHIIAMHVAEQRAYSYNKSEEEGMRKYLNSIKNEDSL